MMSQREVSRGLALISARSLTDAWLKASYFPAGGKNEGLLAIMRIGCRAIVSDLRTKNHLQNLSPS